MFASRWLLAFALLLACAGKKDEHPPNFVPGYGTGGGPIGPLGGSDAAANTDDATTPIAPAAIDPAEVYLLGTLQEGAGYDAMAHWSTPNSYMVGFPGYFDERSAAFRNSDLYYNITFEDAIRQFVVDFATSSPFKDIKYPQDPERNDPVIDSPPCLAVDGGPTKFLTGPTGRLIYRCPSGVWYDNGKVVWDQDGIIIALGAGDLVALYQFDFEVMNLAGATRITVLDIDGVPLAIRSHGDGFHVVVASKTIDDRPELWNVAADGTATRLGIYPLQPVNTTTSSWTYDTGASKLAADDSLLQFGSDTTATFTDIIVRRTLAGESAVVYTEATDPHVKIHISALATGP